MLLLHTEERGFSSCILFWNEIIFLADILFSYKVLFQKGPSYLTKRQAFLEKKNSFCVSFLHSNRNRFLIFIPIYFFPSISEYSRLLYALMSILRRMLLLFWQFGWCPNRFWSSKSCNMISIEVSKTLEKGHRLAIEKTPGSVAGISN